MYYLIYERQNKEGKHSGRPIIITILIRKKPAEIFTELSPQNTDIDPVQANSIAAALVEVNSNF